MDVKAEIIADLEKLRRKAIMAQEFELANQIKRFKESLTVPARLVN